MAVLLAQDVLSMASVLWLSAAVRLPLPLLAALLESSGKRQRGDSNPCGQSPMDFESISLAARTHCLGWAATLRPSSMYNKAPPPLPPPGERRSRTSNRPGWGCLSHESAYSARRFVDEKSAAALGRRALPPPLSLVPSWRALGSDSEEIRTPAGRAQWISSPSP